MGLFIRNSLFRATFRVSPLPGGRRSKTVVFRRPRCCVALGPSVSVISVIVMPLKLINRLLHEGSGMSRSAHGVPSRACKWTPSPQLPRRGRTGATGQTGQRLTCDIQHPVVIKRYIWQHSMHARRADHAEITLVNHHAIRACFLCATHRKRDEMVKREQT